MQGSPPMGSSTNSVSPAGSSLAWFCLRSQPKHEHIAAAHLRQYEHIEVFNPRIRYARSTRKGPMVVTESLFPNYLFARFNWKDCLNRVHYAPGIIGVVHFGSRWPTVPDEVMVELRRRIGETELFEIPSNFSAGDDVKISGGIFHGLEAVITQVLPARQRVIVLLDFLGRQTSVELELKSLVRADVKF